MRDFTTEELVLIRRALDQLDSVKGEVRKAEALATEISKEIKNRLFGDTDTPVIIQHTDSDPFYG